MVDVSSDRLGETFNSGELLHDRAMYGAKLKGWVKTFLTRGDRPLVFSGKVEGS